MQQKDNKMWTIRDATPADYARIYVMSDGLQQYEFDITGYPILPPEQTTTRYIKEIIDTATTKNGEVLVVDMNDETVAYLVGYPTTDGDDLVEESYRDHAHIADLFVEAKARKQGIARALMQTFQDRMKAKGSTWLRIGARANNQIAIGAYENFGFEPITMKLAKKL